MLGDYLQYLREQAGWTRAALAARAGLDLAELERIETGERVHISGVELLALSDGLQLEKVRDFASLVQRNGRIRRFRIYAVGLPKTGTNSIFGIFRNYIGIHDFKQTDTQEHLIAFRAGKITRPQLAGYLLQRDRAACAELDSGSSLLLLIDLLAETFPDARFIGLLRDPFSWVNSLINYYTSENHEAIWSRELPNGFPFDLPRGANAAKAELINHLPQYIEGIIAFWANSVRTMLAQLPPGRSLLVRTHDIAGRLADLASFAGIPEETLCRDLAHLNRSRYHVNALSLCQPEFLHGLFQSHCADLLADHFPEFSLEDSLRI